MPTFAHSKNQAETSLGSGPVQSNQATTGPGNRARFILRLQRTAGNRAVTRLLRAEAFGAGPGKPLEPAVQRDMEGRFGHDFSQVRVHTDAKATESARAVDALAYTVGRDIVFSEGSYRPGSREGSRLLAHELAHVVQQDRGGPSGPPLSGGDLEQAADTAASAYAAGRASIGVAGASAPGLARQPQPGAPAIRLEKPRSLTMSLPKDEKDLDDAALMREIGLIQDWLKAYPSSPEADHLRSELDLLEDEELVRMEKRGVQVLGSPQPKEGSAAQLAAIVHQGRLEAKHRFWPDHKHLAKGVMEWKIEPPEPGDYGGAQRGMQVRFTPGLSVGKKTVTFLQTWRAVDKNQVAKIDQWNQMYAPFYSMDWDPRLKKWIPAVHPDPAGFKNQPSSPSDPRAYMSDRPWVWRGGTKVFETVAVVPETGEILGALRWGLGEEAGPVECTDRVTASFLVALDRYYATPAQLGPIHQGDAIYDAILDGFKADDATLTAEQKGQLDSILAKYDGSSCVAIGGFGDAADRDPMGISEQRAQAVASYVMGKGVPKDRITLTGFGATWARYQVSTKEARAGGNRRVQLRLRALETPGQGNRPGSCDMYPITGAFEVPEHVGP